MLYFLSSLRNTYQHSFVGWRLKSKPRKICQNRVYNEKIILNWTTLIRGRLRPGSIHRLCPRVTSADNPFEVTLQIVCETNLCSAKHQVVGVGSRLLLPMSTPTPLVLSHSSIFCVERIQNPRVKKKNNEKRVFITR